MDLGTHILAGGAIGATVMHYTAPERRGWAEGVAFSCGMLSGTLMDMDEYLPYRIKDEGLSYLLYHRGHTHTVLACLVLGLLIAGLAGVLPSRFRPSLCWLAVIGCSSALMHLLLDGTNDYGVHPFWPVWNGWLRGEFIFLMEPLIMAPLLPLALRPLRREWGSVFRNWLLRPLAALPAIGLICFIWYRVSQPLWMTVFSGVVASAWIVGQWILQLRWKAPVMAWASVLLVWLVFLGGSVLAKERVASKLASPEQATVDLNTTPAPSNPFCWRVIATNVHPKSGDITARRAVVNLLPGIAPDNCWLPTEGQVSWTDNQVVTSRAEFELLADRNCYVKASKVYLQTPFIARCGEKRLMIGDLRIDYEGKLNRYGKFCVDPVPTPPAEQTLNHPCDFYQPPWHPPDLWKR